MTSRVRMAWLLLLTTAACKGPAVTERVVTHRETLSAVQASVLTGPELSAHSQRMLRVLDLQEAWETDPESVPGRVLGVDSGRPAWELRTLRAELYYALAKRASGDGDDQKAQSLFLEAVLSTGAAAHLLDEEASVFDPRQRLAAEVYNRGLARFLALGQQLHGYPTTWTTVLTLNGPRPFHIATGPDLWDPDYFDELIPAEERQYGGRLVNRHRRYGLGATLIAVREPDDDIGKYEFPVLQALPATAILMSGDRGELVLSLANPMQAQDFAVRGHRVPISEDFTAPLGHFCVNLGPYSVDENVGFFDPGRLAGLRGLYMIEKYDPERIPLLLVHGLWSSPATWLEFMNEFAGDPVLRSHYQVWLYLYPTGLPIWVNQSHLRRTLEEIHADLAPKGGPPMKDIVVVGHSMGGILSKTLVSSTCGEQLWRNLATKSIEEVNIQEDERETLREAFVFEPLPYIGRVLFIATPHRGSATAHGVAAGLGKALIKLPARFSKRIKNLMSDNPDVSRVGSTGLQTSIHDLSELAPYLQALTALPIRERLPYHTIVGDIDGTGPPDCTDGVVSYRSSRLPGAVSEHIVRSGHGVHRDAGALLIIRRILRDHAVTQN